MLKFPSAHALNIQLILIMPYLPLAPPTRGYFKQSLVRLHNASLSDVRKTTDKVRILPMLMASRPML